MERGIFIIAEAGVNHNGDINLARKLVDAAVSAGADAVKFQTFKAEKVISRYAPKAEYQTKTTPSSESQLEMVKKLELDDAAHRVLIDYCTEKGILFLSTPFDLDSIDLLHALKLSIFKIPSGEITNLPYLRKVGSLNKKIILSTGMSTLGEVEAAIQVLMSVGTIRDYITVLHCNTEYPTPFHDVNLLAMLTMRDALKVSVGYSDHTKGIEIPVAAAALGATVIEKHFTIDRTMEGPDHKASLEPNELAAMVDSIRNVERALGDGIKKPSFSEIKNREIARRSIIAAKHIFRGEMFTKGNLDVKRPGTGISPMEWDRIIGNVALRDFEEDELITI